MQFVQFPPDVLILPESHCAHSRLPISPVISSPALQMPHTVLLFLPSVYFPCSQFLHDNAPGDAVNVSTGQSTHVNVLKYFPAGHGTCAICPGSVRLEFPPIPSKPTVMFVQSDDPTLDWYRPCPQALHLELLRAGWYCPGMQLWKKGLRLDED